MNKELIQTIDISTFDYPLDESKIARYPLAERDNSKLLLFKDERISKDIFKNVDQYLPPKSQLVLNNTKVIQARLLFRKDTGAEIEIFCLEPVEPADYYMAFAHQGPCLWKCMVGNSKKWKEGFVYLKAKLDNKIISISAERIKNYGETSLIKFIWGNPEINFGQLLESAGTIPIPPYLNRESEATDLDRYQTIYSKYKGSVAAPTAGLHFTQEVNNKLDAKSIQRRYITLHVGAGTFKPVSGNDIAQHEMHTETFSVDKETILNIKQNIHRVIAVGTTSARALESIYWLGNKLYFEKGLSIKSLFIDQWEPYQNQKLVCIEDALHAIINYLEKNNLDKLEASTSIMIVPGYEFKIIKGLITNFHLPKSTLLLLVSAFIGDTWKNIYTYALNNNFRFLSYGDSMLLLPKGINS